MSLNNTTQTQIRTCVIFLTIWYYNCLQSEIGRAPLLGASHTPVVIEVQHCERLAVDWVAENIYYTDASQQPAIVVCKLYGQDLCAKLVEEGLEKPRAIVVYPSKG